jgi:hypothetical protein
MKSSTVTLIKALEILSKEIQSEDGVANAAIAEAADRLKLLNNTVIELKEIIFKAKAELNKY